MHDHLRDFGRAIAQPKELCHKSRFPMKPSILWSPECARNAIQNQEVTRSTLAMKLGTLDANFRFVPEEFAKAGNLRFLELEGGNFEGDFKNVFQQLKWLSWFDCPSKLDAINLGFRNLVILKLTSSQIDEKWGGWSAFMDSKHLKTLHLEDCKHLKRTPNFSTLMRLERLILRDCSELEEIDTSINKLKHLNCLEISNGNVNILQFLSPMPARPQLIQGSMEDLKSVEVLKICNAGLKKLDPSIGKLVHLKHLYLRHCPSLESLPRSIGELVLLVELDLSYSGIKELPDSIGNLKYLNILKMKYSPIEYLPATIEGLESLEELNLKHSKIILLPETIGNLKRLKVIKVSSSKIRTLPEALLELESLERLEAALCMQMDGNLPEEIGKLSCLRILYLFYTTVSSVPKTINQLSHLEELDLHGIDDPQELSRLPSSLIKLSVASSSLESHRIPDLSHLTNLVSLSLHNRTNDGSYGTYTPFNHTPPMKWLASLTKLKDLNLDLPDLVSPPTELSSLSHLQSLVITCLSVQSLPHLPSSLSQLRLINVMSPIDWQHLSSLNDLSTLVFINCWLEEIKVDCLEHLHCLMLYSCEFLERLSNLSCLKMLQDLEIKWCPDLVEIEGLGELESLLSLSLESCSSIPRLPNLSRLKKLQQLSFSDCKSLGSIPEVDEEAPCRLHIFGCDYLPAFYGPYSNAIAPL